VFGPGAGGREDTRHSRDRQDAQGEAHSHHDNAYLRRRWNPGRAGVRDLGFNATLELRCFPPQAPQAFLKTDNLHRAIHAGTKTGTSATESNQIKGLSEGPNPLFHISNSLVSGEGFEPPTRG
jgi:hypothetical protein